MTKEKEIKVPDIGGASQVDVIEVLVKVGDLIEKDTPLITLESDKASMEIPSPWAGTVKKIMTKVGAKLSEGDVILLADHAEEKGEEIKAAPEPKAEEQQPVEEKQDTPKAEAPQKQPQPSVSIPESSEASERISAGPAVRRLARELGVDLQHVAGSGRKDRVTKEDIQGYVKAHLNKGAVGSGWGIAQNPAIDFSQFGGIETKPLSKIKKLTGANVHRSWITIPHVTQFDEADITDLEAFRTSEAEKAHHAGYKLTLLAFICRVVSKALQVYPQFNASLDATGEHLIYKQYCNIGIAVETPNGLVVPVIKNVSQLSVSEIAQEMTRLSAKARDKGLMPVDMSGGCFTISSLGGIGGTAFTPIVNSPEVAILGVSRSAMKPMYDKGQFIPRLMLPLSLSYDHRVIDGAEAARFTRYICDSLTDIRRILL